ncbi:MAG: aminotransferase class V-fold PLP-dependent enzyme [Phycisphaeraceae bacterium]
MSHQPTPQQPIDGPEAFPILDALGFFNHAGVAPISGRAAETLHAYARHAASRAYVAGGWHKRIAEIRGRVAQLINARSHREIAFMPNTSAGLAQVANGLAWHAGDEVVITNVEYPANRYPWVNLARRHGVRVVEIAQQPDGRIELDDVIEAVTDRTRVVALSHVQYASGHRIALKPLADTVHQVGGYLCVDGIQSVGTMPVDVQTDDIDFLAADGHKWMLGPEGAGFLYCREDLVELMEPNVVGWMNMVDALDFGNYRFELLPDARRFEPGSFNVPGLLAMGASVDLLLEVGLDTVWQRIEALTTHLCDALEAKGYPVFSPRRDARERSGIVVFDVPAAKGEPDAIAADLARRDIIVAVRNGRLRASPHYYNTCEQLDRLVAALP